VKTARRSRISSKKFTDDDSLLDWRMEIANDSQNDKWVEFVNELPPTIILSVRFLYRLKALRQFSIETSVPDRRCYIP